MPRKKKIKETEYEVSTVKGNGTNKNVVTKNAVASNPSQAINQAQSDPSFSQSDEIVVKKKKPGRNMPQTPQTPQKSFSNNTIHESYYTLMVSRKFIPYLEKSVDGINSVLKETRGRAHLEIKDKKSFMTFLENIKENETLKPIYDGIKESFR